MLPDTHNNILAALKRFNAIVLTRLGKLNGPTVCSRIIFEKNDVLCEVLGPKTLRSGRWVEKFS